MAKRKPQKEKKPVGRPRRSAPYEEAREIVRAEGLASMIDYKKWWMHNKPSIIPKNPQRSYVNTGWVGWGDFLGTHNPFPCSRRSFRSYKEARAWAHTLGLKSKAEWMRYTKREDFPDDVPRRPDIYWHESQEWLTWRAFLGYEIQDRVAVIGETDHIIYIIQYAELPANVFTISITNEGKQGLLARQAQYDFRIVAGFYHDKTSNWFEKIEKYVKPYHLGRNNYIVHNVVEVISEFTSHYIQVR